jgi:hypothetical protein
MGDEPTSTTLAECLGRPSILRLPAREPNSLEPCEATTVSNHLVRDLISETCHTDRTTRDRSSQEVRFQVPAMSLLKNR